MTRKKYPEVPCEVVEQGSSKPCGKPSEVLKRRMCFSHYRRMQTHGDPTLPPRKAYRTPKHLGCQADSSCTEEVRSISHGIALCNMHNTRMVRTGTTELIQREPVDRRCILEGCEDKHKAKGLCSFHYDLTRERQSWRSSLEVDRARSSRNKEIRHSMEGFHTQGELDDLLRAHGKKCLYCGVNLPRITRKFGRDHTLPVSRGGTDFIENIAPSCPPCNFSKGTRTIPEFRIYLEKVRMLDGWSFVDPD